MCKDCNNSRNNNYGCNKCKETTCKCTYSGPEYIAPEIYEGQDINEAISNLAAYTSTISFEDGVGIEEVTNNGDGTFTILLTNGDTEVVGNFTGPVGPSGLSAYEIWINDGNTGTESDFLASLEGPPGTDGVDGITTLVLQNRINVASNGVDGAQNKYDLANPYLTLNYASTQASVGDTIIVHPGTYTPGSDWIKSGVKYYFMPGTFVTTSGSCIVDSGNPKDIAIFGYGVFRSTAGNGISLSNSSTNIELEFDKLIGYNDGISIANANLLRIKGNYITTSFQYLATLRGNCSGTIDVRLWDGASSSTNAISMYIVNHSTDLTERILTLKGEYLVSNSTNVFGAVAIASSGTVSLNYMIDNTLHTGTTDNTNPVFYITSGKLKVSNCNVESTTDKLLFVGSTLGAEPYVFLKDVNSQTLYGIVDALTPENTIFIQGCNMSTSNGSAIPAIASDGDGLLVVRDSQVYSDSTGADVISVAGTRELQVYDCVFENSDVLSYSVGGLSTGISVATLCSNVAVNPASTNNIGSPFLVTDANIKIIQNPL